MKGGRSPLCARFPLTWGRALLKFWPRILTAPTKHGLPARCILGGRPLRLPTALHFACRHRQRVLLNRDDRQACLALP